MKTAAIIAEYNPFHNGHKYQIDKAKELLGNDTAIIAIMSGNYTQRGELAITDKTIRAEAAVNCGVNLVLELPFPYSSSSAEFFANSAVHIAESLKVVDHLVFGSECGNISELLEFADNLSSNKFKEILALISASPKFKEFGYPSLCEIAYKEAYGTSSKSVSFTPNNILSLEYIKALRNKKSLIVPITIKREGAGYNAPLVSGISYQSATAIRETISKKSISALDYIPDGAKSVFSNAFNEGKIPSDPTKLDTTIISHFRLNTTTADIDIHDAAGGLYNRLCAMSAEATSISSLISMTETKKYTTARIRRAILNSYFGVTSSDVRTLPGYTQVLAMDNTGREILKRIKKMSDFPILTKPSAYRSFPPETVRQKELCDRADAVYGLTLEKPNSGRFPLTFTPYVKK